MMGNIIDDMNDSRRRFMKLADRLEKEDKDTYMSIIENLRNFEYDDFDSKKYATPKIEMYSHLTLVGLHDDAKDVLDGLYDQ